MDLLNPRATLGPVCEMSQAQKQSPASKTPEQEFHLYIQFCGTSVKTPFCPCSCSSWSLPVLVSTLWVIHELWLKIVFKRRFYFFSELKSLAVILCLGLSQLCLLLCWLHFGKASFFLFLFFIWWPPGSSSLNLSILSNSLGKFSLASTLQEVP